MWFIMLAGGLTMGIAADLHFFRKAFFSVYYHIISFLVGIMLLRAVLLISRHTGRILAQYGREGDIPRMETNRLVREGPYGYMRHPMHFGLLFFPLSIALIVGSPAFTFIIAPLEMIFMLLMIKFVEEPEARKKFGKMYDDYAKDKPWFCVKIKCLKSLFKKVPPA